MSDISLLVDLKEHFIHYKEQFNTLIDRYSDKKIKFRYNVDYLFIDLLHISIHTTANNLLWADDAGGADLLRKYLTADSNPHIGQDCNFEDFMQYLSEAEVIHSDEIILSMEEHLQLELASLMVHWTDDIMSRILLNIGNSEVGMAYFNTNTDSDLIRSIDHTMICPIRDSYDVMVIVKFK